jgi:recombination protein RecR
MYPPSLQKLINFFSRFPGMGPKMATRFVFFLLKKSKKEIDELIESIAKLKENIKICRLCFNPFEPGEKNQNDLCEVCSDKRRDKSLLCVIANETDLVAIEKTKKYKGLYFILGGTLPVLKKKNIPKTEIEERIELLKKRIKQDKEIEEIILALNPTPEGETTALYLERVLKDEKKKITRLGIGLPLGGELEYADEETIFRALEGRK